MNLKLNNDETEPNDRLDPLPYSSAEERRRTGRYVAIVVGISLVCLAIYHAWVRKIPVLASLLVPALIMLLYIAWVLYTAARDKKKAIAYELELARFAEAQRAEAKSRRCQEVLVEAPPNPSLPGLAPLCLTPLPPPVQQPRPRPQQPSQHPLPGLAPLSLAPVPPPVQQSRPRPQQPPQHPPPSAVHKKKKTKSTPKSPNSPKGFRRAYSIA